MEETVLVWIRALLVALVVVVFPAPLGANLDTSPIGAKAQLRVIADSPLTLRGSRFRSRDMVHVVVKLGSRRLVRTVRAGLGGAFTITFAGVRYDPCGGTPPEITARGVRTGLVSGVGLPRDCAMP